MAKERRSQKSRAQGTVSNNLTIKVIFIIGSQLISWISLLVAAAYFTWLSNDGVPDFVFEVFATVIIPINSLLNPIFYSDMYVYLLNKFGFIFKLINKPRNPAAHGHKENAGTPKSFGKHNPDNSCGGNNADSKGEHYAESSGEHYAESNFGNNAESSVEHNTDSSGTEHSTVTNFGNNVESIGKHNTDSRGH